MIHHLIAVCFQTHAANRGHAADDNIHKECHTLALNPEQTATIEKLVAEIKAKSEIDLNRRCEEWHAANPDEEECTCEGEEFVGSTWVECGTYDRDPDTWTTNQEDINALIEQLQRINADYDGYCDSINPDQY